ncbi:hypothetical protein PC39_05550 [Salinisphaera sp. PC39]|uniref:alginate export family protein n=1 Tax=Salinisphaera sp. PC39 TaxID=1304156 RepID=UPI00334170DA
MTKTARIPIGLTATILMLAALPGARAADGATGLERALTSGTTHVDARLRHERAEQDNGLRDADATTLRLRLGYQTDTWNGLDALAEFEGTFAIGGEDYNSGPAFLDSTNGHTGYTTIADPTDEQINRAWLRYRGPFDTEAKVGRQRLILDNARFIGNVGWRQNEQTFDAVSLVNNRLPGVVLRYAWVRKQHFVLYNDNKMDTHLLNASYAYGPEFALSGYGYFVDFRDDSGPRAPGAPDHKVFGLRATGDIGGVRYALEYADQSDHADAPSSVDAEYYLAEMSADAGPLGLTAGYEVLGGDGTYGFQTPLATNHAFQGFADVFLTTPASGVRDRYGSLSATWAGFRGTAIYHDFRSDEGSGDLGSEVDLVVARPLTSRLNALVKYADYSADDFGVDTRRFWVQAEYAF